MATSWLKSLKNHIRTKTFNVHRSKSRQRRRRPMVEALEGRLTPAAALNAFLESGVTWYLEYIGSGLDNNLVVERVGDDLRLTDKSESIVISPAAAAAPFDWHPLDLHTVMGHITNLSHINIDPEDGADTIQIKSTGLKTVVQGGGLGDNKIIVGGGSNGAQDVAADIEVSPSTVAAITDVVLDDTSDTTGQHDFVCDVEGSSAKVTGFTHGTVKCASDKVRSLTILGGAGTDSFTAKQTPIATTYDPHAGKDSVKIDSGATLHVPDGTGPTIGSLIGQGDLVLGGNDIIIDNSGATQNFSGRILGTGGLTKDGTGTQGLSGANSYSGPTNTEAGTLSLNANNVLPDGTAVTVSSGAPLALGSVHDTIGSLAGDGNVNLGGLGGALTAGGNGASTNFGGAISGFAVGFTKTGA